MATNVHSPALYDKDDLSVLLKRSRVAIDRDRIEGRIPPGFRIGRLVRWTRAEIDAWIQAGCPHYSDWKQAANHPA